MSRFNSNTINFKAGLDASGVATGKQKIEGHLQGLNKKIGGLSSSFKGLGGAIAGAMGASALGGFLMSSIKGAEAAQTHAARIDNIAKSMGVFGDKTEIVTKRIKEFAEKNEILLATDADIINQTQAKLLTFKELALTADVMGGAFDRATIAAVDMAAAGFGEATMNAVQLGKALNDPIAGINALTRNGITFTQQEKEKIKTLVESNRILAAQDMILKAIETQVGGTAAATADATVKIGLHYNRLKDVIGASLLPMVERLADKLESVSRHGTAIGLGVSTKTVALYEKQAKEETDAIKRQLEGKNLAEKYAIIQKQLNNAKKEFGAFEREDSKAAAFRVIYYGKLVETLQQLNDEFVKGNTPNIEPVMDVPLPTTSGAGAMLKSLEDQKKAAKELNSELQALSSKGMTDAQVYSLDTALAINLLTNALDPLPDKLQEVNTGFANLKPVMSDVQQRMSDMLQEMNRMLDSFVKDAMFDLFTRLGEGLFGAARDVEDWGHKMIASFGGFLQQMGAMIMSYGFAMDAFKKAFKDPLKAVIAGAALIAIGAGIKATHENKMNGGAGAGYSPPMQTTSDGYNFQGRVDGYDIVLVTDRNQRLMNRRG